MWNLTNCKLKTNHFGHNGYLNCVTVSPDGSLCASGGKVRIVPVPTDGVMVLLMFSLGWECDVMGFE